MEEITIHIWVKGKVCASAVSFCLCKNEVLQSMCITYISRRSHNTPEKLFATREGILRIWLEKETNNPFWTARFYYLNLFLVCLKKKKSVYKTGQLFEGICEVEMAYPFCNAFIF